jgi:hypothetical protein
MSALPYPANPEACAGKSADTAAVGDLFTVQATGFLRTKEGPLTTQINAIRWLSLWHGNRDVAKFEAAGVVALNVERSGLSLIGIERAAGDPVDFFVVDG